MTRMALLDVRTIEKRERKKCRFGYVGPVAGVLLTKSDDKCMFEAYTAPEEMETRIEQLEQKFEFLVPPL